MGVVGLELGEMKREGWGRWERCTGLGSSCGIGSCIDYLRRVWTG